MITIKEIAKEANVAISTVSNVLNKKGAATKASKETREKILKIAKKHNYSPCAFGKGLRKGKSYTVAILGDFAVYDSQVGMALLGVEKTFKNQGYSLLFISYDYSNSIEVFVNSLLSKRIDGVIIIDKITKENRELFAAVAKVLPTVKIFADTNIENIYSVFANPVTTIYLGIDYLFKNNHRKIMILGDRKNSREVISDYTQKNGFTILEEYIFPELRSFEDGCKAIEIIVENKLDVTAIMCFNDNNAAGVLQEANRRGIKIPEELSIIGVGNLDISSKVYPKITTIDLQHEIQGVSAAESLLKKMDGKDCECEILTPTLIERESVRKI